MFRRHGLIVPESFLLTVEDPMARNESIRSDTMATRHPLDIREEEYAEFPVF